VSDTSNPAHPNVRPFVIGLTGNIACGKSTVVSFLKELGAVAIDADAVYHDLIVPEAPLWHALVDRYGTSILAADGTINRRALGRLVFRNPAALEELERLTHPAVVSAIRERVGTIGRGVVVIDAVKLIESGLDVDCDQVWVVRCDPEQQIDRLIRRNGLSHEEAAQRIEAQPAIEAKFERADVMIDNSGSLADTRRQVERAWRVTIGSDLESRDQAAKTARHGSVSSPCDVAQETIPNRAVP
jgi:dephospho-CoA kinase